MATRRSFVSIGLSRPRSKNDSGSEEDFWNGDEDDVDEVPGHEESKRAASCEPRDGGHSCSSLINHQNSPGTSSVYSLQSENNILLKNKHREDQNSSRKHPNLHREIEEVFLQNQRISRQFNKKNLWAEGIRDSTTSTSSKKCAVPRTEETSLQDTNNRHSDSPLRPTRLKQEQSSSALSAPSHGRNPSVGSTDGTNRLDVSAMTLSSQSSFVEGSSGRRGKSLIKKLVSKNKKRFSEDGFDLDLTYITDRVIAMGFPAESLEKIYRNNMLEVQTFFNRRHTGHYKIYNLCSERTYRQHAFQEVGNYPFDDHMAPPFDILFEFCKDVDDWLRLHPENVAGIHCKAGKGRTGVMICCYLLFCNKFSTADESLEFYARTRTYDGKGVTIRSQRRYVRYFESFLKNFHIVGQPLPERRVQIVKLRLRTIPKLNFFGKCEPWFVISNSEEDYVSTKYKNPPELKSSMEFADLICEDLVLKGDVLITFYNRSSLNSKEKLFHLWFNTSFLTSQPEDSIEFTKTELDGISKKLAKKLSPSFVLEIFYVNFVGGFPAYMHRGARERAQFLKQHWTKASSLGSVS